MEQEILPQNRQANGKHKFPKGNKLGKQFPPGESANPGGRPKAWLSEALARRLPSEADEVVAKLIKRSKKNSFDLNLLWNRAEGAVPKDEHDDKPTIQVLVVNGDIRPRASSTET